MREALTSPSTRPTFVFRELDGAREIEAAEALRQGRRADRVTSLLAVLLSHVDEQEATADRIDGLASGVREWLLQKAVAARSPGPQWLEGNCRSCGYRFDFEIDLSSLPYFEGRPEFPIAWVQTSYGPRAFEAPCGHHERQLQPDSSPHDLARLCALDSIDLPMADDEVAAVERALEEIAPEPTDRCQVGCPSCGEVTAMILDPFAIGRFDERSILGEIHRLATAYGWSEADILSLPSHRRRRYLDLIAESRGTSDDPRRRRWLT